MERPFPAPAASGELDPLLDSLELAVLAVLGYRGVYWSRLTAKHRGAVDCVPWASSSVLGGSDV